jgi:GNAT superfamily N-acetyltransferase
MTGMQTQEQSEVTIRSFGPGDERTFLDLIKNCFGSLEYPPRLKAEITGPYLDHKGSFIAEKDGAPIGCVGLRRFPKENWSEIRYLAVRSGEERIPLAQTLVSKAIQLAEANHVQQLKAFVPAVEPFVGIYKKAGFTPARRSLRISWDLTTLTPEEPNVQTRWISKEHANEAADVWVEGLRPYWDFWIEEQGGPEGQKAWVRESVGTDPWWIGAFQEQKLVGLSMLRADAYGPGEARFNGAYVLPKHREQRIGSALMRFTILEAQRQKQKKMNVYTLGFLDYLAPGSLLYLKSGGKIEAEYLQLERS